MSTKETSEEMAASVLENYGEPMEQEIKLPSAHQIKDSVFLYFWSSEVHAEIHAVHFYPGKVKYDLNVFGDGGDTTRLYNVDSVYVSKFSKK